MNDKARSGLDGRQFAPSEFALTVPQPIRNANPDHQYFPMTGVLVLYCSSFGHVERMTEAEAQGARSAGARVDIKRVSALVPRDIAHASHSTVTGGDGTHLAWAVELEARALPGLPRVADHAPNRDRQHATFRRVTHFRLTDLARGPRMPRYDFRLVNGDEVIKLPQALELPGPAAAREDALALARDLKDGKVMPERDWSGWQVAIVDQDGHTVDTIPVDLAPPDAQLLL
jgi:hypothetical protein